MSDTKITYGGITPPPEISTGEMSLSKSNQLLFVENKKLQARIDSLLNDPMTKHEYNKIKAEGIREMAEKEFKNTSQPMEKADLLRYADKLEKGDE